MDAFDNKHKYVPDRELLLQYGGDKPTLQKEIDKYNSMHKPIFDKDIKVKINENIVTITSKTKTIKAEYDLIGVYNVDTSVWYWGWSLPVNKLFHDSLKKIKEFPNYIKKNYERFNKKDAEEYLYMTSNNNMYISHKNIEKLIKLSLYLLKGESYVIVPVNGDINRLEYLNIKRILQHK